MTATMSRRLWLAALLLYSIAAAADMASHLADDSKAGRDWRAPASLSVAFSASLFWPADLVVRALLGE
jgi:hypothetical protein